MLRSRDETENLFISGMVVKVIVKGIVCCSCICCFYCEGFLFLLFWALEVDIQHVWKAKCDLCVFDLKSPRISAYEIHDWIHTQTCLNEQELTMVQIDGTKQQVYIKFRENGRMHDVLH